MKKQRFAIACWAMSATGITSSEPGAFAIQVLWPSMYGSARGRWMRVGESCWMRPTWRSIISSGVSSSTAGSTSAPASLVGKKYVPESSVKNSSAVWKPAADGNVRPAAPPA